MSRILLLVVLMWTWGPAGTLAASGQEQSFDTSQSVPPVSTDRVRDGLKRPELQIPALPPQPLVFRSEVTVRLETPLDVIRRELRAEAGLPPWKGGPPVTPGIDLLPALMGLVAKVKTIRHEHLEAEARQMVQRELADFCSTHDCSQVVQEPIEGMVLQQ